MVRNNNLNSVILSNPDNNFNPYDAASPLPVSVTGGGSSDATAANQVIGNTSLSSMDGKITSCDTGSISGIVAVSAVSGDVAISAASLPLPSGSSTSANQATANSSLGSIDGKITTCDTGNMSGTVSVSGNVAITAAALPLPSGSSTAANQATGNGSLASIATAVGGTLLIKQNEVLNEGSYANAANNASIAYGAYSSVISIANMNVCSVFYQDSTTSSFDSLKIEVSPDGTNYFDFGIELYPSQEGAVRKAVQTNLHVEGLTHMRLKNNSAFDNYANVYGTIVGSP